jgi:quinol-cytochrome oxidoreductase complex cytochrome b subunit
MRVFFTGAYRRPRELNWVIGMLLLLTTLLLGFTGYSLAMEQLSYWGATVASNIAAQVPGAGGWLRRMLLAGDAYNERTLPRLYVLHAVVLPAMLVLLVAAHIVLVRLHGVAPLRADDEPAGGPGHFPFFPDHVLTELAIGLALMLALSAVATLFPAAMGPPADPLATPEVIKPEWYFYATFRWLKLFSATFAVLSAGLIVLAMIVWPWLDRLLRRLTGWEEASTAVGVAAVLLLVGLTTWEALAAH